MLETAFPFWARAAVDPDGGFFEKLDIEGCGIPGVPSRVRLQARMGFTYALMGQMGWNAARAEELAARSVDVLVADCRRPDGLYGKIVRPGEGLIDDAADTYDTAFALLAFATVHKVFGCPKALAAGRSLTEAIEDHLARPPKEGGYRETLPAPEVRQQNPHMHLTEASLAWFDATRDDASLRRAEAIAAFVEQTFYRPDLGLLVEQAGVPDADNRVEAGHMFEWVWILGRMRELGGAPFAEFSHALHAGGMRLLDGLDYIPLSQNLDGGVIESYQRTWGPSEKLKGHIAQWRMTPTDDLLVMIATTAEAMFADHVDGALEGAWIDVISPERDLLIEDITPATGYHIFLALLELIALARDLSPAGE